MAVSTKPVIPTRVHADVRRVADETAGRLRTLGHEVEQDDPPFPPVSPATFRYLAGMAQDAEERVERPDRLQRRTKSFARMGNAIPRAVLDWAVKEDDSERMRPFFERHDVLLTPVSALPPVRAGQWEGLGAVRTFLGMVQAYPFALEWNLTGQPSISVPVGRSDDGLPIGMQLVGRHGEEAMLLALAAQLEGELRWTERRPPVVLNNLPPVRQLRIQDTLSGGVVPVEPSEPGRIGIYACGPTVYGRIHVGNARPYLVFSLLKRFLEHEGYDTSLVINITDVNDKIYDAARERGVPSAELAARDDRRLRGGHRPARPRPP